MNKKIPDVIYRILPSKNVRFCDSLIFYTGLLNKIIDKPMTTDQIRLRFKRELKKRGCNKNIGFELVWYSLLILYSLGKIELGEHGDIIKPVRKHET